MSTDCLPIRGPLTGPKIKLGRSTEGPGGGAWLQVCGRSECVGAGVGWGSRVTYRHEASTTPWTLLRQRRGPGSGLRGRCGFGVKTWRAGPAAGWARRPPGSRGLATGRGLCGGARPARAATAASSRPRRACSARPGPCQVLGSLPRGGQGRRPHLAPSHACLSPAGARRAESHPGPDPDPRVVQQDC